MIKGPSLLVERLEKGLPVVRICVNLVDTKVDVDAHDCNCNE